MSPIRVGLIGLSGAPSDQYQGTGWAAMAHLPYLLDSDAYTLAALCNTSVESAKNALKLHNLPESIKTYGSVEGTHTIVAMLGFVLNIDFVLDSSHSTCR